MVFFLGVGVVETRFSQLGDFEGDLHDLPGIERVKALQGIEEIPDRSGVFFLEKFRICGAALFAEFGLHGL